MKHAVLYGGTLKIEVDPRVFNIEDRFGHLSFIDSQSLNFAEFDVPARGDVKINKLFIDHTGHHLLMCIYSCSFADVRYINKLFICQCSMFQFHE